MSKLSEKKPSDIISCAADLIEERGRAFGAYQDGPKYCMAGAVKICCTGNWTDSSPPPVRSSLTALNAEICNRVKVPAGFSPIPYYNDNRRRRDSTIVRLMRKVAAQLREKGE